MKRFSDLTEQEVLALAITNEEEDSRIYRGFAEGLREQFPSSAKVFDEMAEEEVTHRTWLFDLYRKKFGEYLPLIRRQDVKGFIQPQVVALADAPARSRRRAQVRRKHGIRGRAVLSQGGGNCARRFGARTAREARRSRGGSRVAGAQARRADSHHGARAKEDETARRMFVLQYVQPGLAGLMDGSVSTLAPLFAAAFATHNTWATFLVGMAASVGAGISMGFAEALSDDGSLTGRGTPWLRGTVCGLMTAIGGLGHTLPYLIPHFLTATIVSGIVVAVELVVISWIRTRFMDTPFLQAAFQVVVGGVLVFIAGILIGSS